MEEKHNPFGEKSWRGGGSSKKLKFTYEDIAKKRGVTVYAVRKAVERGLLDPEDLDSICRYIRKER